MSITGESKHQSPARETQWVYLFGKDITQGRAEDRDLLGGKGANLAEMAAIGLPVPPGFTITTEMCSYFFENDGELPEDLKRQVKFGLTKTGELVGAEFGNPERPLLVSIRSGARVSMPGMMDTVLNLGLNDQTVEGLAERSGDKRFAYDSYRRFIQMYGDVVLGVEHYLFEDILESYKNLGGIERDTDLTAEEWKEVIDQYKTCVLERTGQDFPGDLYEQLWGAIKAVFQSWHTKRAETYRRLHNISDEWGTAVNVQAMVFGNMGDDSATGVAFTRNPSTGEKELYGEYLINAQGEDVVAGIRTPQPLTIAANENGRSEEISLEELMPAAFAEFSKITDLLEQHYRDCQDIEFTIQHGKLWILQTRAGKRTAAAAVRMAVEMQKEGLLSRDEALMRINPAVLDQLLHPSLEKQEGETVIVKGLPASPGAASGRIVFNADEAEELSRQGQKVILVRIETSPEDIHGMHAAEAILTSRGGMTSHAAVVARGMGTPCVSGAGAMRIDYESETISVGKHCLAKGDVITLDGGAGEVYHGALEMRPAEFSDEFSTLMEWADETRRMKVRTNAETLKDTEQAMHFGAEGIGLCRTEHMFFDADRIHAMRKMILSDNISDRRAALAELLPMQREDFKQLFQLMKGRPVTIRLLDPPLHEFLPHNKYEIEALAESLEVEIDQLNDRIASLHELNPMLGHRGCRLAISYPEITEMQAQAIFEAAIEAGAETGIPVVPEIMVPLILSKQELDIIASKIEMVGARVFAEKQVTLDYQIGTMIELPRAALMAEEISERAEFFSFGTNDLTQTTFGLSRDDSAPILESYAQHQIFPSDPFVSLDQQGVGQLIKIAVENGRKGRVAMKMGICGEHGGDPASIVFCEKIGLDYVSCSPFRVPIARLAAAQAVIEARAVSKAINS